MIQPVATLLNCTLWVAYGFMRERKDRPIVCTNLPGVLLRAVALATAI